MSKLCVLNAKYLCHLTTLLLYTCNCILKCVCLFEATRCMLRGVGCMRLFKTSERCSFGPGKKQTDGVWVSVLVGEFTSLMGHLICSFLRGNERKPSHAADPKPLLCGF